jgi:2-polyprenyl-3-methyl-5-hydroxy-6-metoxy-1,4-benzoquinol methylase
MKATCCALCNNTALSPHLSIGEKEIVRCRKCGFLFSTDIPSQDQLERHYSSEMKPDFLVKYKEEAIRRGELILALAGKSGGRIMDVGCGLGFFLAWAKEKGYETCGVEPSIEASEYARNALGLAVFTGDVHKLDPGTQAFDIVTIQHVLEHIPDPVAFLRRVKEILKEDGVLAVVVPNAGSLVGRLARERWLGFAAEEHLCHYTKDTLRILLIRSGFRVRNMLTPQWSAGDLLWAARTWLLPSRRTDGSVRTERPLEPTPHRHVPKNVIIWLCRPLAWVTSRCGLGQEILVLAGKDIKNRAYDAPHDRL